MEGQAVLGHTAHAGVHLVGEVAGLMVSLGTYSLGQVVIHLEVERLNTSDVRTLRIYKSRGSAYAEGRQAFEVNDDGIQFLGSYDAEPRIDNEAT